MPRDIQFDLLEAVRSAGVRGSATLYLSRPDAMRLVDGLSNVDSMMTAPEHIETYAGPEDNHGTLVFRLDEELSAGYGAIEQRPGERIPIALPDVMI